MADSRSSNHEDKPVDSRELICICGLPMAEHGDGREALTTPYFRVNPHPGLSQAEHARRMADKGK